MWEGAHGVLHRDAKLLKSKEEVLVRPTEVSEDNEINGLAQKTPNLSDIESHSEIPVSPNRRGREGAE